MQLQINTGNSVFTSTFPPQNINNPKVSYGRNIWRKQALRLLLPELSNQYESHSYTD